MGQRGRPPKPTAIKRLQGTLRRDRSSTQEPRPDPTVPSRPGWLRPEAKREWTRLASELGRLGLLTIVDRGPMAGGCEWWAIFVEALGQLRNKAGEIELTYETPTGQQKARPEIGVALQAWKEYLAFCSKFGLTPSDRSRIHMPEPQRNDLFAQYLAQSGVTDKLDEDDV